MAIVTTSSWHSDRCPRTARRSVSNNSVTSSAKPLSLVAPINCSRLGCRHLDAICISRSNSRLLWGDTINSCICFIATTVPRNFPSFTQPQAPWPSTFSVITISSRDIVQSRGCILEYSSTVSWARCSARFASCSCSRVEMKSLLHSSCSRCVLWCSSLLLAILSSYSFLVAINSCSNSVFRSAAAVLSSRSWVNADSFCLRSSRNVSKVVR